MTNPNATNSLKEWLIWLEKQHPEHEMEFGLDRLSVVATQLALFPWKPWTFTIAGTNGKGSTAAFLETLLLSAGYSVGCYTSPHLVRYNERVRIKGQVVSDQALASAFDVVHQAAGKIKLTYFEYGTLVALYLFQQAQCDVAILEVGLGGRLDAVNLVDPDVAIITTIDLDHQQWLGCDRESIGREKSGIFRAQKPAICGDKNIPNSVLRYAKQINAPLFVLGRDFHYHQNTQDWEWLAEESMTELPNPHIQLSNAAAALMALKQSPELQWNRQQLVQALQNVSLPGRLQYWLGPPLIILDVAHNPQATATLAAHLLENPIAGKTYALIGMLADKDIANTLAPMLPYIDKWFVASLPGARGTQAEILLQHLQTLGAEHASGYPDVLTAFEICHAGINHSDRLVVFGSFHIVGPILEVLEQRM